MRPVKQTRTDKDTGNCFAACVATVLGVKLSDVPDFIPAEGEESRWFEPWQEWFTEQGIGWFMYYFSGDTPINYYILSPGALAIVGGVSPRAIAMGERWLHAVVCRYEVKDGKHYYEYVHDPHPDGGFIAGEPMDALLLWRQ